ncbi:Protein zer-1 [Desmophyllum pertusum]|uniref:Protein zer-1 n=1 Tax=Desmophyllum pertusum TaxID=174260 RepID=A0A9W9YZF6_9CNID|nr:Protein zer-1 [Desmophyllum pertusum]
MQRTLQWLSIYNCRELFWSENPFLIETLQQLTQLQHLDLSKDDPEENMGLPAFLDCSQILVDKDFLERLLPSLPNLTWLDLSGNAKFSFGDLKLFQQCYPQMLKFLGLFMTDMCSFPEIPADQVSGNGNVKQITLSVKIYNNRPTFLTSAMRELFNIIRDEYPDLDKNLMCNVVLGAMESQTKDKHIQLAGR